MKDIWTPADKQIHLWVGSPVYSTICGIVISTPYLEEEMFGEDAHHGWCYICSEARLRLFDFLRNAA